MLQALMDSAPARHQIRFSRRGCPKGGCVWVEWKCVSRWMSGLNVRASEDRIRLPLGMSSIASLLAHWMALAAWVLPQPTPVGGACWAESGSNETACSVFREKVRSRRMTTRRGAECADTHVRFACASVRRSHANVALHVISSRHHQATAHTFECTCQLFRWSRKSQARVTSSLRVRGTT